MGAKKYANKMTGTGGKTAKGITPTPTGGAKKRAPKMPRAK